MVEICAAMLYNVAEVKKMLFRKNIDKSCSYCKYAGKIDDSTCLCTKKGIVFGRHHCWRFKYDPLKRVPSRAKPKDFSKIDDLDFSL